MKGFIESIFKNKNTTLVGIGVIIGAIGKFLQDKDFSSFTLTITTGIGLLISKDGNKQ